MPYVKCNICLMTPAMSRTVRIGPNGLCNYCQMHVDLSRKYPTGNRGLQALEKLAKDIKRKTGDGKVIVGVSGGTDSSYMLRLAKFLDLNPIAVNFDNGWSKPFAMTNMQSITKALNVPLVVRKVDFELYNHLVRAFLNRGLPDFEAPADIGLAAALYEQAELHQTPYIFEGHNFRTEGIAPMDWLYMDYAYISDVAKRSNISLEEMNFPDFSFSKQLHYRLRKRVKLIRPLYHLSKSKRDMQEELIKCYNWTAYSSKHGENLLTAFWHQHYMPARYGIDHRYVFLSAQIRSGYITRAWASDQLKEPPRFPKEDLEELMSKLGVDAKQLTLWLNLPKHSYKEYNNYRAKFKRYQPLFWLMLKCGLVHESFYRKFCRKGTI